MPSPRCGSSSPSSLPKIVRTCKGVLNVRRQDAAAHRVGAPMATNEQLQAQLDALQAEMQQLRSQLSVHPAQEAAAPSRLMSRRSLLRAAPVVAVVVLWQHLWPYRQPRLRPRLATPCSWARTTTPQAPPHPSPAVRRRIRRSPCRVVWPLTRSTWATRTTASRSEWRRLSAVRARRGQACCSVRRVRGAVPGGRRSRRRVHRVDRPGCRARRRGRGQVLR